MIRFTTRLQKFAKQGEKTGWTYIEISASQANTLNPGVKVSYRVKGKFDNYEFSKIALVPMGEGKFIIPLKAAVRKAIGKKEGDKLNVSISLDKSKMEMSADLMACLKDEPEAMKFFSSLPASHQRYFSNWIESAKTDQTKTKRIVMAITAFLKKQGYGEMIRENKTMR